MAINESNKPEFEHGFRALLSRLENHTGKASRIFEHLKLDEFPVTNKLAEEFIRELEVTIWKYARTMYNLTAIPKPTDIFLGYTQATSEIISEIAPVKYEVAGHGYRLELPAVSTKTKDKVTTFIWQSVFNTLSNLRNKEGIPPIKSIENASLFIIHHLDSSRKTTTIPDADNLELKRMIDILSLFFFKSDDIVSCHRTQIGVFDSSDYTEVFIIPQENVKEDVEQLKIGIL